MWKRFLPFVIFVLLAIMLAIGLTRDPSKLPSQMIDKPLPAFRLAQLDPGAPELSGADIVGEVMLMNVFGSWCVACLEEHPLLMQIGAEDRVRLVGIDWRDTREDARNWLTRHGDPYDVILFDGESDLAIDLGVTGAPETFIVDRRGNIRYKHTGVITPDVWREKLLPLIEALEAEEV